MLDEFAINLRKVSDESLGRDETPRHASQVFNNFSLYLYEMNSTYQIYINQIYKSTMIPKNA